MTPNSLFNIILKVLGIFFLKNFLLELAEFLPVLRAQGEISLLNLSIAITATIIYLLIIYLLLFKTNWIINRLALDKGFKEGTFNLNIHRSVVLSITIIIIGGLIIIEALPSFIQQLLYYIQMKKDKFVDVKFDYVILHFAKLVIGIFLIVYQKVIINFIEIKRKR
jgi:hypothetical protein